MINLRELATSDMKELNEKDWGLPVVLISPDGIKYNIDKFSGKTLRAIQILYDYRKLDPATGEEITVNEPVVSIARAALERIPAAGEKWSIQFPVDPSPTAEMGDFILSQTRAPEGGRSVGFIRLYPQKVKQS